MQSGEGRGRRLHLARLETALLDSAARNHPVLEARLASVVSATCPELCLAVLRATSEKARMRLAKLARVETPAAASLVAERPCSWRRQTENSARRPGTLVASETQIRLRRP